MTPPRWKVVRTDCELELPRVDAALRAAGASLALLPESVSDDELARELADADLLLMCYRRIDASAIRQVLPNTTSSAGCKVALNGSRGFAGKWITTHAIKLAKSIAMKPAQMALRARA